MRNEIWTLAKIDLKTNLGFNEARNSSNPINKRIATKNSLVFSLTILLFVFYSTTFAVSFSSIGAGEAIPTYYLLALSTFLALFSFINAGSKIFSLGSYEKLIVLPIKPFSIIGSRFLVMLLENEIYSLAVFLPGIISYGVIMHPAFAFYPLSLLLSILVPLFPMTIASIIGVLFTGLFSKTNHKNIITSIFSIVLVIAIVAGSFYFSFKSGSSSSEDASALITNATAINNNYFMAKWAKEIWVDSNWLSLFYFALVSIGSYAIFVLFTAWRFVPICLSLQEKNSGKKFQMVGQKRSSQLISLVKKDLKMYFNSRTYLVNTIIGYVFWVAFAVILPFIPTWFGLTDQVGLSETLISTYPFLCSFFVITGSTTSIAISYEAKQWWLTCSLPIKSKTLYASKVIMNLVVFLPFYLLASILFCSICRTDALTYTMAFVYPPVFAFASGYFNLWINIHFPKFNWTNETEVVKNSASSIISFLAAMLLILGPFISFFFVKDAWIRLIISLSFLILIISFGLFFYWRVNKREPKDIAGD